MGNLDDRDWVWKCPNCGEENTFACSPEDVSKHLLHGAEDECINKDCGWSVELALIGACSGDGIVKKARPPLKKKYECVAARADVAHGFAGVSRITGTAWCVCGSPMRITGVT